MGTDSEAALLQSSPKKRKKNKRKIGTNSEAALVQTLAFFASVLALTYADVC
jgi:hypothetical protein